LFLSTPQKQENCSVCQQQYQVRRPLPGCLLVPSPSASHLVPVLPFVLPGFEWPGPASALQASLLAFKLCCEPHQAFHAGAGTGVGLPSMPPSMYCDGLDCTDQDLHTSHGSRSACSAWSKGCQLPHGQHVVRSPRGHTLRPFALPRPSLSPCGWHPSPCCPDTKDTDRLPIRMLGLGECGVCAEQIPSSGLAQ
jgi:hypothetical protein